MVVVLLVAVVGLVVILALGLWFWLLDPAAHVVAVRESVVFKDGLQGRCWLLNAAVELVHAEAFVLDLLHLDFLLFGAVEILEIEAVVLESLFNLHLVLFAPAHVVRVGEFLRCLVLVGGLAGLGVGLGLLVVVVVVVLGLVLALVLFVLAEVVVVSHILIN